MPPVSLTIINSEPMSAGYEVGTAQPQLVFVFIDVCCEFKNQGCLEIKDDYNLNENYVCSFVILKLFRINLDQYYG